MERGVFGDIKKLLIYITPLDKLLLYYDFVPLRAGVSPWDLILPLGEVLFAPVVGRMGWVSVGTWVSLCYVPSSRGEEVARGWKGRVFGYKVAPLTVIVEFIPFVHIDCGLLLVEMVLLALLLLAVTVVQDRDCRRGLGMSRDLILLQRYGVNC